MRAQLQIDYQSTLHATYMVQEHCAGLGEVQKKNKSKYKFNHIIESLSFCISAHIVIFPMTSSLAGYLGSNVPQLTSSCGSFTCIYIRIHVHIPVES